MRPKIATFALVCDRCGRDLVYLNLARIHGRLRPQLDSWASRWFGCDCPDRQRLTGVDSWAIAEAGAGAHENLERWTRFR